MLSEKPLRKFDILVGGGVAALGVAIIVSAAQMPMGGTYGGVDNPWYASPAAMPLFIGGGLLVCAASIIMNAVKRGGHQMLPRFLKDYASENFASLSTLRGAFAWVSLLLYAAGLAIQPFWGVSRLFRRGSGIDLLADPSGANYVVCSFVFLFAFALGFYRPGGKFPSVSKIALLAAGSLIAGLLVAWVFSELLRVPLP